MDIEFLEIKEKLEKYGQSHLLEFYDELYEHERHKLLSQLHSIDFEKVNSLYENLREVPIPTGETIEPIDYSIKKDIPVIEQRALENIGTEILKQNSYAVLTMAGGQGTRLGHKGPKGTFELNLFPKKVSLFEILADKIARANKRYKIEIPWFIMTSENNNQETIEFFKQKNYFGLNKYKIYFFVQDKLPIVSSETGKILLSETYQVNEASNGNGDLFEALNRHHLIEQMRLSGIKWVFVSGIDNILVKIADPIFLGLTIKNNCEIGAKTIFKQDPYSNDWVFCKKDGKPAMLGHERITEEITNAMKNGKSLYREVNILCHLFSVDAIEKIANLDLPYHRARKKNTFINDEGMKIVPETENSFKFEKFIFDSFKFFDNIALLRVEEEKEFAPIKDPIGVYSPETATKLYMKETFNL